MIEKPNFLTSKQAAEYLGYSENTLRECRVKGILAGIKAPPYIKMGKRVEYSKEDLDNWRNQFKKITNTAQSSIN